jgi:hypothetical protein
MTPPNPQTIENVHSQLNPTNANPACPAVALAKGGRSIIMLSS